MLARIPLIIFLLTIIYGSAAQFVKQLDAPLLLGINPLQRAQEYIDGGRLEEVLLLTSFSRQYLPVDPEYSTSALDEQANAVLDSSWFILERFINGALTGEARDTPGLLGTMTLDMLVIGDIRDLLVQGYKEYDAGEGDEVIIGLSTAGLLLTVAPELSWVPSVFKSFWRGRRFSEPFQKQMTGVISEARKNGDYRKLRLLIKNFTQLTNSLGMGPTMAVIKHVESTEDLARLSGKAKRAPAETYTLVSLEGIKTLEYISASAKSGKLIKSVKIASRQQKLFAKTIGLIPLTGWLVIFILATMLLFALVRRDSKNKLDSRRNIVETNSLDQQKGL